MNDYENLQAKNSEKYLCLYLSSNKLYYDCKILLDFFTHISDIALNADNIIILQIKLKWYLDALSSFNKTGHELLDNAISILNKYNIDIALVEQYILAKSKDSDLYPFNSFLEIIKYGENTEGSLWLILAEIINQKALTIIEQEAIKAMATRYAIVGILRNVEFNIYRNVHTLIFKENSKDFEVNQKNIIINIKVLLDIAKDMNNKILNNRKILNKKIKKLMFLNNFSSIYIKNIINNHYILDTKKIERINLINKLNIIYKMIFNLY